MVRITYENRLDHETTVEVRRDALQFNANTGHWIFERPGDSNTYQIPRERVFEVVIEEDDTVVENPGSTPDT